MPVTPAFGADGGRGINASYTGPYLNSKQIRDGEWNSGGWGNPEGKSYTDISLENPVLQANKLTHNSCPLALTHCPSAYPCQTSDAHSRQMLLVFGQFGGGECFAKHH